MSRHVSCFRTRVRRTAWLRELTVQEERSGGELLARVCAAQFMREAGTVLAGSRAKTLCRCIKFPATARFADKEPNAKGTIRVTGTYRGTLIGWDRPWGGDTRRPCSTALARYRSGQGVSYKQQITARANAMGVAWNPKPPP